MSNVYVWAEALLTEQVGDDGTPSPKGEVGGI